VPMFKIYVGNLDPRVKIEQVRELFSPFMTIEDAVLVADTKTGKAKGFAIVMVRDPEIGRAAVKATQGKRLLGKTLTINEVMKKGQAAAKAAKEQRQGPFGPHFNRQGGGRASTSRGGSLRRGLNRGPRGGFGGTAGGSSFGPSSGSPGGPSSGAGGSFGPRGIGGSPGSGGFQGPPGSQGSRSFGSGRPSGGGFGSRGFGGSGSGSSGSNGPMGGGQPPRSDSPSRPASRPPLPPHRDEDQPGS